MKPPVHTFGSAGQEAQRAVEGLLGASLRTPASRRCTAELRQVFAKHFGYAELSLTGEFGFQVTGRERVLVAVVVAGLIEVDSQGPQRYRSGDVFLASHPSARYRCRTRDLSTRVYSLSMPLLDELTSHRPQFMSTRPVNARAQARWTSIARYVDRMLAGDAATAPVAVDEAARLLAATTLAVFPHRISAGDGTGDVRTAPLHRAAAFIDDHVAEDIDLCDIASAVNLTPRAVQYLFRRHLDTTPMQYLIRARLDRAHQDLVAGDPAETTVAQIAERWGFAHNGRFAVRYRQTFGQSPRATLHNRAARPTFDDIR